jgi:putative aldouronate transport system permease protein
VREPLRTSVLSRRLSPAKRPEIDRDFSKRSTRNSRKARFWQSLKKYRYLYLLTLPALLWLFIFWVCPLFGLVIAFQDFNPVAGIFGSRWVGLKYFEYFIHVYFFPRLIRNTLFINCLKLLAGFPIPIIFAILLNEVASRKFKKVIQTFSYLPHFVSWIVVAGFLQSFLSPSTGILNKLIMRLGGDSVFFMNEKQFFVPIVILTYVWKDFGWSSIIYLAAIASINQELYEAATIDGCRRFRSIWHITLPSIRSLMVLIIMLSIGNIINSDFGQLLAFIGSNYTLFEVGDVIDTFVYRSAMLQGNFSLATAIGVFKGFISLVMILVANFVVKKFGEEGII